MDSARQIDRLTLKFKVKRCFVKWVVHVEFMQDLEDRIEQFQIIKQKNQIVLIPQSRLPFSETFAEQPSGSVLGVMMQSPGAILF